MQPRGTPAPVPPARAPDHLGDFTVSPKTIPIVLLAAGIGVIGTFVAAALLDLIALITNLVFFQRISLVAVAPGSAPHSAWLILLAPIAGGLVVGAMARFGSEAIRGHGMPEAIDTILRGGSKVRPRVAILKPVSAAISIGTGGPFGAEGPIIMTGGAFGSICAQLLELTADERKTLLVAGAAAGMTATFNAPFASPRFTVRVNATASQAPTVAAGGAVTKLDRVNKPLQLKSATWSQDAGGATVCFDLPKGQSIVQL